MRLLIGLAVACATGTSFANDMPAHKDPVVLHYLKEPGKMNAKLEECKTNPPKMHTQAKIDCWQAYSARSISTEPKEVQTLIVDENKFSAEKARCTPILKSGKSDDQECNAYKKASRHFFVTVQRPSLTGGKKF